MAQVDLSGKVIVVTGGFGALGQVVASTLAGFGARLALIDNAPLPTTPQAVGALLFGGVDLADEPSTLPLMQRIFAQNGRLDGLINIAGGFRWEKLESGSLESWDFLYRLNVRTAAVASKAALPFLQKAKHGRIVNLGAMGALKAGAGMGPYAASKAGVLKLTEALAEELKESGITVNAVMPSILDTPRNRLDMPDADFSRWVTTGEIAQVIAFLMTDAASGVTGALIPVAGRV